MRNYNDLFVVIVILLFLFTGCNNNSGSDNNNTTGNDSVTIDNLSKAIRDDPKNADLFFNRSQLYFGENKIDEAINDMSIAIKLDSLNPDLYIKAAEYYLLKGNSGKAKETLEKCTSLVPENTRALTGLAKIHLYVQQYKESMEYLLKAQKINKHMPDIYFIKGLIYKETFDTVRAIDNFQITVDKEPDHYEAYMMLGSLYSKQKNNLAIDYFNNAKRLVPQSIEAYYMSGMHYQGMQNYDSALVEYENIINNIDSTYYPAHFNAGYINMQYLGNYEKATGYFSGAINYNKQYAEAFHNRGYCYEKLNEFEKARKDYKKAMEIIPNYQLSIDGLNRIDERLLKNN